MLETRPPTFVTATEAIHKSGIGRSRIHALALAGRVRSEVRPGQYPRFAIEDVLAIAREERKARSATRRKEDK